MTSSVCWPVANSLYKLPAMCVDERPAMTLWRYIHDRFCLCRWPARPTGSSRGPMWQPSWDATTSSRISSRRTCLSLSYSRYKVKKRPTDQTIGYWCDEPPYRVTKEGKRRTLQIWKERSKWGKRFLGFILTFFLGFFFFEFLTFFLPICDLIITQTNCVCKPVSLHPNNVCVCV